MVCHWWNIVFRPNPKPWGHPRCRRGRGRSGWRRPLCPCASEPTLSGHISASTSWLQTGGAATAFARRRRPSAGLTCRPRVSTCCTRFYSHASASCPVQHLQPHRAAGAVQPTASKRLCQLIGLRLVVSCAMPSSCLLPIKEHAEQE
jgi:hypothetical protein